MISAKSAYKGCHSEPVVLRCWKATFGIFGIFIEGGKFTDQVQTFEKIKVGRRFIFWAWFFVKKKIRQTKLNKFSNLRSIRGLIQTKQKRLELPAQVFPLCRKRCMDLVSFETRAEYEWVKQRLGGVQFFWTSGSSVIRGHRVHCTSGSRRGWAASSSSGHQVVQ